MALYCGFCLSPCINPLCLACEALLIPLIKVPYLCNQCALPHYDHEPCPARFSAYHRILAGYSYCFPLNKLLVQYKHGKRLQTEALLRFLWLRHLSHIPSIPQALVPVPLHPKRFRRRGFNQAERLARFAAEALGIPQLHLLKKVRHTASQQQHTREERMRNLLHSFQCTAPVKFQHIALVDDVVTTGSTANEAAQTLIASGAQKVEVWALARAF